MSDKTISIKLSVDANQDRVVLDLDELKRAIEQERGFKHSHINVLLQRSCFDGPNRIVVSNNE